MTRTVMPEEMVQAFKPDYIAPLVVALSSDKVPDPPTGNLFEVGSGWVGSTRWQRSSGCNFPVDQPLLPETIAKKWSEIIDFDSKPTDTPENMQDSLKPLLANLSNKAGQKAENTKASLSDMNKQDAG